MNEARRGDNRRNPIQPMSISVGMMPLYGRGMPYIPGGPATATGQFHLIISTEIYVMNGRIRLSLATLLCAVLLGTVAATAQPLLWNPPCGTIRVKNATGLTVTVNVVTTPPGVVGPLTAPPGLPSPVVPVPAGTTVNGITSLGGIIYPVIQPGPPSPPAPFISNGWIPNVTIAPGICVDLYLDLLNCTIYVAPSTAPPPCRP